jgi:lysophospholipase L1-like esterase
LKKVVSTLAVFISLTAFAQQEVSFNGNLNKYAQENRMLKPRAKKEKRVVFMGDSITEFWKNKDSVFFADGTYIDRGISGQTTVQMLVRFRQDVIDLHPDAVVILAGTNDIAQNNGPMTLDSIAGNIKSMAELARANKIKVVLCSVLPAYDFYWHPGMQPAEKIVRLNELIKAYAAENKIVYVDYFSAMADERKGLKSAYAPDGVHPTPEGYKVMEPLAGEGIAKALKKKQ